MAILHKQEHPTSCKPLELCLMVMEDSLWQLGSEQAVGIPQCIHNSVVKLADGRPARIKPQPLTDDGAFSFSR